MQFEWDEDKRQGNLAKHGIDFHDAALVLSGSPLLVHSVQTDHGETRCLAVGILNGRAITIVFTMRGEKTFRIISARKAKRREERAYEEA